MIQPATLRHFVIAILALSGLAAVASTQTDSAPVDLVISVADQKMVVLREGGFLKKYQVSTSRFGVGDTLGSYKTPLGTLRVWEKLGGELPSGAVLKHRAATGEILAANAPGRDPIVSRILWLEGLEAQNDNARGRGIYIHGTTEESNIGRPVSWGCIRMRSEDVIELFDMVPVGSMVRITGESLPHFPKWKPAPPVIIASRTESTPPKDPAKVRRLVPERVSVVGELLATKENRMVPADPGAANAFHGSILFSGLTPTQKPAPKPQARPAKTPGPQAIPIGFASFTLGELPLPNSDFSLRLTAAVPPLALVDLRRVALSPLFGGSIFDAPVPEFAAMDRIPAVRPLF